MLGCSSCASVLASRSNCARKSFGHAAGLDAFDEAGFAQLRADQVHECLASMSVDETVNGSPAANLRVAHESRSAKRIGPEAVLSDSMTTESRHLFQY
jgi:hypothetical protein